MANQRVEFLDKDGNVLLGKTLGELVENANGDTLENVEAGAQVNKIEKVKLDGVEQTITGKAVDLPVYTKTETDTAIATACGEKQDTITGAATTITDDDLTASRALVSDANGKVGTSAVTATELGYLDGVTSSVQDQIDGKVDKLSTKPTAGTYGKVTINAEGQVTEGADLTESDIPSLHLSKVTDVTATAAEVNVLDGITASTAELNIMDGVTVTASDINSVTGKIELTDLSVANDSTNYLEYDNTTGAFGAKVDTTVTANSTNLVTSGAVESAIAASIVGGVVYKGTFAITPSTTDFSGITLPVKKGYMYLVTGTGPATIDGMELNPGDYIVINENVSAGGSLTGKVDKIDNTESSDLVKLSATQTLTNKTIDADDNTISNLETDNFKSGVIQTSVRATATASDTALASEKAVRTELDTKQDTITGAATSIVSADLTASKALVSDANGKVDASAVTATELGYVAGVTSSIQTQINGKADQATTLAGYGIVDGVTFRVIEPST